jgi:hypothetical protein
MERFGVVFGFTGFLEPVVASSNTNPWLETVYNLI